MNLANMDTLIVHLKRLLANGKTHKFNMSAWIKHPSQFGPVCTIAELRKIVGDAKIDPYECRTAACIAGHAALLGGVPEDRNIEEFAAEWLDLDYRQASDLFHGLWAGCGTADDKSLADITLPEAIAELERMRAEAT